MRASGYWQLEMLVCGHSVGCMAGRLLPVLLLLSCLFRSGLARSRFLERGGIVPSRSVRCEAVADHLEEAILAVDVTGPERSSLNADSTCALAFGLRYCLSHARCLLAAAQAVEVLGGGGVSKCKVLLPRRPTPMAIAAISGAHWQQSYCSADCDPKSS